MKGLLISFAFFSLFVVSPKIIEAPVSPVVDITNDRPAGYSIGDLPGGGILITLESAHLSPITIPSGSTVTIVNMTSEALSAQGQACSNGVLPLVTPLSCLVIQTPNDGNPHTLNFGIAR